MKDKKSLKIMSLSVEPEMHELLKEAAKKMKWSTSQLVRELVNRYLDLIVQDTEETPVILRIPAQIKSDKEKLAQWLSVKSAAIVNALTE